MYLSKLLLDPASRQVQKEISNRYELHRTLTAQFPQESRENIGLLYRIEMPDRQVYQPIRLLIQTQLEPNWKKFVDKELLTDRAQVKEFNLNFITKTSYYFRLLGNPTMRKKQPDGSGKRVGLYKIEEQENWLSHKAEQGGFRVLAVTLTDLGLIESIKKKNSRTHNIKHLGIQFDGILTVTNPEKFEKTIIKGIGSAKAFGFGLLSLAKY
ncbi:MAG: type I-E CRISPR-associated protein Cas6/Cse3/CasE [Chloroflexota bacterium]|nr:type I-E CRISPR-associated protein Cas6/Cse3/CasE [Chloroflexota bacterium]